MQLQCDAPFDVAHLFIPRSTLRSAAAELNEAGCEVGAGLVRLCSTDAYVHATAIALLDAMQLGAPDGFAARTAHALAMHLLIHYGDRGARKDDKQALPTDPRITRVLLYIGANFHRPITVTEMASEACLSPFHFARLFRQQVGETPHSYMLAERIRTASGLLTGSMLPISDIATRVGYSPAHFSSAFRRAMGLSPREYRKAGSPA